MAGISEAKADSVNAGFTGAKKKDADLAFLNFELHLLITTLN